jgi:hypothetical protein
MTYEEYVKDVFTEDQSAMGLCEEEIEDLIQEYPFVKIENWLKKRYDLWEDYKNL